MLFFLTLGLALMYLQIHQEPKHLIQILGDVTHLVWIHAMLHKGFSHLGLMLMPNSVGKLHEQLLHLIEK